jgi:hypothetical protein
MPLRNIAGPTTISAVQSRIIALFRTLLMFLAGLLVSALPMKLREAHWRAGRGTLPKGPQCVHEDHTRNSQKRIVAEFFLRMLKRAASMQRERVH